MQRKVHWKKFYPVLSSHHPDRPVVELVQQRPLKPLPLQHQVNHRKVFDTNVYHRVQVENDETNRLKIRSNFFISLRCWTDHTADFHCQCKYDPINITWTTWQWLYDCQHGINDARSQCFTTLVNETSFSTIILLFRCNDELRLYHLGFSQQSTLERSECMRNFHFISIVFFLFTDFRWFLNCCKTCW